MRVLADGRGRRSWIGLSLVVWLLGGVAADLSTYGANPSFSLGAKPSFGLYQPRVHVDVRESNNGRSLGPTADSFLLDTGANSMIVYAPAINQLKANGYVNQGVFEERGLSGTELFDVSQPYQVDFQGSDPQPKSIPQMQILSSSGAVDPTGLMKIHGILGMPAMAGRVVTLDNQQRDGLSMGVFFGDQLPASSTQRFTVPLQELVLPPELSPPSSAPLTTLDVISKSGTHQRRDPLVLDTGAQVSIISTKMAIDLGLDVDGDGDLSNNTETFVPLGGVGGTVNAPVLTLDELRIPTDQGFELVWHDAEVIVRDIDPSIPGVIGADLLSDDGGLDFSFLGGGAGSGGLSSDLLDSLLGPGFSELFGELLGDVGSLGDLTELLSQLGLGDLFGDLGGAFDSFPFEPHFDRVHVDFRNYPERAVLVMDLTSELSRQVLNGDGVFNLRDVEDLGAALGTNRLTFDLNGDGRVELLDQQLLISSVFQTVSGDTNLDRQVDFADFLMLSQNFGKGGGWGSGDFDGNRQVEFADFLLLAAQFGFHQGATASVPEPSLFYFLFSGLIWGPAIWGRRRRPDMINK